MRARSFGQQTPEQMTLNLEKARVSKARKVAERATLDLLSEDTWDRASYWDKAARAVGVERLPDWNEPMTVTRMTVWLNKLGLTRSDVAVYLGSPSSMISDDCIFKPSKFIQQNPRWPLRAFVGTVIENVMITYKDAKGTFSVDRAVPA